MDGGKAHKANISHAISDDNGERRGFGLVAADSVHASTTFYVGLRQAAVKLGQAKDSLLAVGNKHAF